MLDRHPVKNQGLWIFIVSELLLSCCHWAPEFAAPSLLLHPPEILPFIVISKWHIFRLTVVKTIFSYLSVHPSS